MCLCLLGYYLFGRSVFVPLFLHPRWLSVFVCQGGRFSRNCFRIVCSSSTEKYQKLVLFGEGERRDPKDSQEIVSELSAAFVCPHTFLSSQFSRVPPDILMRFNANPFQERKDNFFLLCLFKSKICDSNHGLEVRSLI